jgi:hypothetical protein
MASAVRPPTRTAGAPIRSRRTPQIVVDGPTASLLMPAFAGGSGWARLGSNQLPLACEARSAPHLELPYSRCLSLQQRDVVGRDHGLVSTEPARHGLEYRANEGRHLQRPDACDVARGGLVAVRVGRRSASRVVWLFAVGRLIGDPERARRCTQPRVRDLGCCDWQDGHPFSSPSGDEARRLTD